MSESMPPHAMPLPAAPHANSNDNILNMLRGLGWKLEKAKSLRNKDAEKAESPRKVITITKVGRYTFA